MARILLIEPDAVLARTYVRALETSGHEARIAATAQAGIDAVDDAVPDLVLLELQLVAHSGIEFLYELRSYAEWQTVPVIIVSHVPPGEFRDSAIGLYERLGVRDYYYKPHTTLEHLVQIAAAAVTARL